MIPHKNKKTTILLILTVSLLNIALVSVFWAYWYSQAQFDLLSRICGRMAEMGPEAEQRLLTMLKQYRSGAGWRSEESGFLLQHGYRAKDFWMNGQPGFWIVTGAFFVAGSLFFLLLFFLLERKKRRRIEELTAYLEQVNLQGVGTMIPGREDEFSLLQDEIYKTVTALYQTRENALKAKENYADNLANIAHQLKTPITAASVSLQLFKAKEPSLYVEQALGQLERLGVLEEGLLRLSRIDSGNLKLKREQVDIYTVLNLAADNLCELLEEKQVTVEIPEHGCIAISGDMNWTMEAFLNLLKNCMEHSASGGRIYCDYSQNPLYVEILIWDEGAGFAKEDLPYLFKRFYRGKDAGDGGIGIGLALAKSIFELQNGTITARNLPDGGACFEVRVYSH